MAYASLAALQSRLGATVYARLTDRVAGATPDDLVGQALLDEADAEANAYLARRYTTPIDPGGDAALADALAGRVLDLAEYRAWQASPFVNDLPSRVKAVYFQALDWLRAAADGEILLTTPLSTRAAAQQTVTPRVAASPRAFTHDELDGL